MLCKNDTTQRERFLKVANYKQQDSGNTNGTLPLTASIFIRAERGQITKFSGQIIFRKCKISYLSVLQTNTNL
jgi:hypothetical protein